MKTIRGRNLFALVLLLLLVLSLLTSAATPPAASEPEPTAAPSAPEPSEPPAPDFSGLLTAPAVLDRVFLMPASAAVEAVLPSCQPASASLMRTSPVMMAAQTGGDHGSYMSGADGNFFPDRLVTRSELAQALWEVVAEFPDTVSVLYDVPHDAEPIAAIQKVVGLGLMTAPNGLFRPNDPATHADCAFALAALLPYSAGEAKTFADVDVDHWAYDAISRAGGAGLFSGDEEGNFAPEDGLKRWEQAAAFNRLLGRGADQSFVAQLPAFAFFSDVPAGHPGYWDVLEAAVPHACAAGSGGGESWLWADVTMQAEDGPRRINRRLYWVQNGQFVREQYIGYLYFDTYGRYTTGSANLDVRLNNIIEAYTNSSMSRDQKLRALFNYCRDNYTYLKRPLISKGQTGWEPDYALFFLNNGRGNCYCFSATYCLLCRNLGLQAYTVVGRALNSPHGWVEIKLDGTVYLFDTQLEWRYLHDWGMRGYNFFKQPYNQTTVAYSR